MLPLRLQLLFKTSRRSVQVPQALMLMTRDSFIRVRDLSSRNFQCSDPHLGRILKDHETL